MGAVRHGVSGLQMSAKPILGFLRDGVGNVFGVLSDNLLFTGVHKTVQPFFSLVFLVDVFRVFGGLWNSRTFSSFKDLRCKVMTVLCVRMQCWQMTNVRAYEHRP